MSFRLTPMFSRRPLLQRVALWMAAVLLLLTSHVLGAPFVEFAAMRYAKPAEPVLVVFYAPLIFVARNPDAPGHTEFMAYLEWCHKALDRTF